MKSRQWVRIAILLVSGVSAIAIDWLTGHYSGAAVLALVMVGGLHGLCGIEANKKQERIDELQREVRLLASMIG